MSIPDLIERVMVLPASQPEVWEALTDPRRLAQWFPDHAEIDLRPGGKMRLRWDQHGVVSGEVVSVDPPNRFVFRWHPFTSLGDIEVAPDLRTQVEFLLEEHLRGTKLTVRETGFSSLPQVVGQRAIPENEMGWDSELYELRTLLSS